MKRKSLKTLCSLALTGALLFGGIGNAASVIAAEESRAAGSDIGIISATMDQADPGYGDMVTLSAVLYNYGSKMSAAAAFYVDGKKVADAGSVSVGAYEKRTVTASVPWQGNKGEKHYVTCAIQSDGDTNHSNNNCTVVVNPDSTNGGQQPDIPTPTISPTPTETPVPTVSPTPTETPVPTVSPTPTETPVPTVSPTPTETPIPTVSPTPSPEPTEAPGNVKAAKISVSGESFTTVTLTWGYDSSSEGEIPEEYAISINGKTYTANAPGSMVIDGLQMGQTYKYTVTARNGGQTRTTEGSAATKGSDELKNGVDLVVSDILWEPANPGAGDQVAFRAVITNQGRQASNNAKHGVRFYMDNQSVGESCGDASFFWCDTYQQSLASGQSAVVTVNGNYNMNGNMWTAKTGTHKVTAFVDDGRLIGESDENNNFLTKDITVAAAQPPVEIPVDPTNAENVNVAAPGCYGDKENHSLSVFVNGKQSACIDAWVNTARLWNIGGYETTPVTIFEMKEEAKGANVRIALPAGQTVRSVTVRPLRAGIQAEVKKSGNGSYVEFNVNKCGNYSVEFNGETKGALQVFVNPDYTNHQGEYPGSYLPLGTITWNGGMFGGSVYGSGILCSSHQGAVISPGSGTKYNGVTILNEYKTGYGGQGSWEVELCDKGDVEFNYFRIIACSPNSDGISIQSSSNIRINNCYIRTWDDGVVLKNYTWGNTNNVHVKETVFWTDLAQSMEIGAETNKGGSGNPEIWNASFEDIDVIHTMHKPAISIHNMDNANIHDIIWKNVTIEDCHAGYNAGVGDGWPLFIDITNVKGGEVPATDGGWTRQGARGSISYITYENIRVLDWESDGQYGRKEDRKAGTDGNAEDHPFGYWTGGCRPGIRMLNSRDGGSITGITFKDVVIGGIKLTSDNIKDYNQFNSLIGGWGSDPVYEVQ